MNHERAAVEMGDLEIGLALIEPDLALLIADRGLNERGSVALDPAAVIERDDLMATNRRLEALDVGGCDAPRLEWRIRQVHARTCADHQRQ